MIEIALSIAAYHNYLITTLVSTTYNQLASWSLLQITSSSFPHLPIYCSYDMNVNVTHSVDQEVEKLLINRFLLLPEY